MELDLAGGVADIEKRMGDDGDHRLNSIVAQVAIVSHPNADLAKTMELCEAGRCFTCQFR